MFIKSLLICLSTVTILVATPQTIVFDFGGVMTGEPNREAVVTFLRDTFQLTEKEFKEANLKKREAIKSGKTDMEFWAHFAKENKRTLPDDWVFQFKSALKDGINPNLQMFSLVEELKLSNVKVALLSNIDKRLSNLVREFGFYEPFHPCLLSCDIGIEKPHREVYEIMLHALQVSAEDVIFIDDRIENIEAAQAMDIDAILFQSMPQLRQELEGREVLIPE